MLLRGKTLDGSLVEFQHTDLGRIGNEWVSRFDILGREAYSRTVASGSHDIEARLEADAKTLNDTVDVRTVEENFGNGWERSVIARYHPDDCEFRRVIERKMGMSAGLFTPPSV